MYFFSSDGGTRDPRVSGRICLEFAQVNVRPIVTHFFRCLCANDLKKSHNVRKIHNWFNIVLNWAESVIHWWKPHVKIVKKLQLFNMYILWTSCKNCELPYMNVMCGVT